MAESDKPVPIVVEIDPVLLEREAIHEHLLFWASEHPGYFGVVPETNEDTAVDCETS